MKHYITAESFGAEIPENWEEIAEQLNAIIDERGIADDLEAVNDLWDEYWSNGGIAMKSWYIVDDCTSSKGEVFTRKVYGSRDEAIAAAADVFFKHLQIFMSLTDQVMQVGFNETENTTQEKVLEMTIEDMDLSMRAYNCLKRAGIHTVAELVQKNQEEMMKVRNLGKKSLEEVEQKLAALGLNLRTGEE